MNPIVSVLILALAMVIVEVWDFRGVSILSGVLGGALVVESILIGEVLKAIPLAIFSIVFLPVVLFFSSTRTKMIEEPPVINRWLSMVLLIVLVICTYAISLFLLGVADIQWPLILVGVYAILSKTDLRKTVVGVAVLTYAVHLLLPVFDVVIEGTLLGFSGGLILTIVYFAQQVFALNGSLSTKDLRKLRY